MAQWIARRVSGKYEGERMIRVDTHWLIIRRFVYGCHGINPKFTAGAEFVDLSDNFLNYFSLHLTKCEISILSYELPLEILTCVIYTYK